MRGNTPPAPPLLHGWFWGSKGSADSLAFSVHGACASWDRSSERLCTASPRQLPRPLGAHSFTPQCVLWEGVGQRGSRSFVPALRWPTPSGPQGSGTRKLTLLLQGGRHDVGELHCRCSLLDGLHVPWTSQEGAQAAPSLLAAVAAWLPGGYEVKLYDPGAAGWQSVRDTDEHISASPGACQRSSPAGPSSEELCGEPCFRAAPSPGILPASPCVLRAGLCTLPSCTCSYSEISAFGHSSSPPHPPCASFSTSLSPSRSSRDALPSGMMVLCKCFEANVSISFLE